MCEQNLKENESKSEVVCSVEDYLRKINNFDKTKGHLYLYRGHYNCVNDIKPSVFRKECYLKKEDFFFNDVLSRMPEEFSNCKYTVEKLIIMQHFEIPTRLLDFTENPLNALFFACYDYSKDKTHDSQNNGEVIVYHCDEKEIENFESDKVSVLANICRLRYDQTMKHRVTILKLKNYIKQQFREKFKIISAYTDKNIVIEDFMQEFKYVFNYVIDKISAIKEEDVYLWAKNVIDVFNETLESLPSMVLNNEGKLFVNNSDEETGIHLLYLSFEEMKDLISEIIYKVRCHFDYDSTNFSSNLTEFIKNEKPYFENKIPLELIASQIVLRPPWNNERIKKQEGYFILFGNNGENKKTDPLNEEHFNRIIISGEHKDKILEELDQMNFNLRTLLPDMQNYATYIKEKFSK